jgi:hypothetical protein
MLMDHEDDGLLQATCPPTTVAHLGMIGISACPADIYDDTKRFTSFGGENSRCSHTCGHEAE